jgi:UDP-N-acetylglucosamine 2-epimerase
MYQIEQTLFALDELEVPTLWFWPNVDAGSDKISKGIRKFRELHKPKYMHFFKNMAPEDFLRLVYNSKCLIGNSSVLVRECAFFGVPAVLVGSRQKYRDKAENVVEVGYDRKQIKKAILSQMDKRYKSSNLYGDGHAGERIAKILETIDLSITKSLKRIDSLKLVKNE